MRRSYVEVNIGDLKRLCICCCWVRITPRRTKTRDKLNRRNFEKAIICRSCNVEIEEKTRQAGGGDGREMSLFEDCCIRDKEKWDVLTRKLGSQGYVSNLKHDRQREKIWKTCLWKKLG